MTTRSYVEVGDTKLYYEFQGSGHPLLFIGGGSGMDRRLWDDQFDFFADDFRTIRYDPRGLGKSPPPTGPYSPSADLGGLVESLQLDGTYLVGLSSGGAVAIDFTLTHPEKVAALVLVAPALSGYRFSEAFQERIALIRAALREGGVSQYIKALLEDGYLIPAAVNPAAREKARRIWAENTRVYDVRPQVLDPPAIERLGEIRVPTLIIVGDRDHPDLYEIAAILESNIAGAWRVTIPAAGHTVNMERPNEFNQVVLDFLRQVEKK